MTTDQPTQPLDLDAIRQRAEAATPGPWWAWDRGVGCEIAVGRDTDQHGRPARLLPAGDRTDIGRWEDAEFIAHAREDIPALLAEVERLRAVVDAARAWRNGDDVQQIGVDEIGVALIEAIDALDAGAGAR